MIALRWRRDPIGRPSYLTTLRSSQVLVFLILADYLPSDYCGRELQVFREHIEKFRKADPNLPVPFLQPVVWLSMVRALPPPLDKIQPEDARQFSSEH